MGAVVLYPPVLVCSRCGTRTPARKAGVRPGDGMSTMHVCRGLRGLLAPLMPEGVRHKVEAVERGDYVRDEVVQRDADGRPVMAVEVTRDDGTDRAVLAPCATWRNER